MLVAAILAIASAKVAVAILKENIESIIESVIIQILFLQYMQQQYIQWRLRSSKTIKQDVHPYEKCWGLDVGVRMRVRPIFLQTY